jgi:hypothetical protein
MQTTEKNTPYSSRILKASILTFPIVSMIFIVPTIIGYWKSPPDAMKAIGYFFIIFYGLIVGCFSGGAVSSLFQVIKYRGNWKLFTLWFLTFLVCIAIAVVLFVSKFRAT